MARRDTQSLTIAALAALVWNATAFAQPRTIAHLEGRAVRESSGVAASRVNPGIFWTHNDSGGGPHLYPFDRNGRVYGRWTVPGARAFDWEDIAVGPGPVQGRWYIYVGDIGSNELKRREVIVYRVEEPKTGGPAECRSGCKTAAPVVLRLRYPDSAHNAETLMVHPTTGDLYIISKASGEDPETVVFVARSRQLVPGRPIALTEIATLDIPEPLFKRLAGGLTGGDISPDGRRVVLCDYIRAYEAVLPAGAKFDDIWKRPFTQTMLGLGQQVEGICYSADGKSIIATAEAAKCPVIEVMVRK